MMPINTSDELTLSGTGIYNKDQSDRILYNSLAGIGEKHKSYEPKMIKTQTLLPGDKYTFNSLGYRSDEFTSTAKILVAGCSQTYGIGVPDSYVWGDILSKKLEMSYANIGLSGKSIPRIVHTIFSYFKEVGNPEYLFVVFPEMSRLTIPVNEFLTSENDKEYNLADTNINKYKEIKDRPRYSKAPHLVEQIITQEFTIWESLTHIQMLEQYCSSSNITLRYGSFDTSSNKILKYAKRDSYYKYFIDLETDSWLPDFGKGVGQDYYVDGKNKECHTELMTENNSYYWRMAGDRHSENGNLPHFGIHRHIHLAEIFEDQIKNV
jgi:hypothetical protein